MGYRPECTHVNSVFKCIPLDQADTDISDSNNNEGL